MKAFFGITFIVSLVVVSWVAGSHMTDITLMFGIVLGVMFGGSAALVSMTAIKHVKAPEKVSTTQIVKRPQRYVVVSSEMEAVR